MRWRWRWRCSFPNASALSPSPCSAALAADYSGFSPANWKAYVRDLCVDFLQTLGSSHLKLQQIHAFSIRRGVPISSPTMGKHLIFTTVSLSAPISFAARVFSQLRNPNAFTWNTMIRGYAESEDPCPAIELHRRMHAEAVEPNTHTYPFLLKAISRATSIEDGQRVHSMTTKDGFESSVFTQNALVHMYASCGQAEDAHKVFESMPVRNVVSWNSVINGYALNGRPNEALSLFREMSSAGGQPDSFTLVSMLSACAELGALALGRRAHMYMFKVGLYEKLHAANALIDLYSKCGSIKEAQCVFNELGERSVVSWTSLIVGLAANGLGKEALAHFSQLKRVGLAPTEITFVGVLYACSHCGIVEEGYRHFNSMKEYGLLPKIEHYGCMVDLLGRAGRVQEAYEFIQKMPIRPNVVLWRTLLGACAVHGHASFGEVARANIMKLEPKHSGDYVLLANLYASESRWSEMHTVRRMMARERVKKIPGLSFVELKNHVYEFVMGDRSHPQSEEIYSKLTEISNRLKLEGHQPNTQNVFADIEVEEKEDALHYHSEKIAIAFMLINTISKTPIRVMKNLRICTDCHSSIEVISRIYDREIIVRDRSRFHHFRDGSCSCQGYW